VKQSFVFPNIAQPPSYGDCTISPDIVLLFISTQSIVALSTMVCSVEYCHHIVLRTASGTGWDFNEYSHKHMFLYS